MTGVSYQQKLDQEAELWGAEAERQAESIPPDWRYHRTLRHNVIVHAAEIEALLAQVQPGMVTLELGCGPGWLTLAMAQRGATAVGIDISTRALAVARAYYESIRADVPGSAEFRAADLNTIDLPADHYDLIAVKATLHHLVRPDHLVEQIHGALKPGGLLWVRDSRGSEPLPVVLVAGALMFVLPTYVSYGDKLRGLLRFGARAPSRLRASMEAEGLSPFEGVSREHDWFELVQARFTVERQIPSPAFTGYITAQVNLPDSLALPLLRGLCAVDRALVRLGLLRGTGLTVYARKAQSGG